MPAIFGPSPWNRSAYDEFRSGYKRITKREREAMGLVHSLSSGWSIPQDEGWKQNPDDLQWRILHKRGHKYKVLESEFEDFIGFNKFMFQGISENDGVFDYIDNAFSADKKYDSCTGVGHIRLVEYSPTYQVMRVTFTNRGDVCAFLRVPISVYAELEHFSADHDPATFIDDRNVERHVMGARFWDIVRIRGTRHGTHYRFHYVNGGSGNVEGQA